ncbi:group II intron maturase-specific domain-containing protein [Streptomyces fractus]
MAYRLNRFTAGWAAYFGLADSVRVFAEVDHWTRCR